MNSPPLDLGGLGFHEGAHLLLTRALRAVPPGASVLVSGADPALGVHLRAWCRGAGHGFALDAAGGYHLTRGRAEQQRWAGAERAGGPGPDAIVAHPPAHWGLAARGALVEAGGSTPAFDLADRDVVWADLAPKLYAHAAAAQWDPATKVDWDAGTELPDDIEAAVVQVMTYLVENEQAALVVPARLLARVHPHFREVRQLLAVQAADETRHVAFGVAHLQHQSRLDPTLRANATVVVLGVGHAVERGADRIAQVFVVRRPVDGPDRRRVFKRASK